MFLAATHTGTFSSTDSRNCLVDASCLESLRCSLQSSMRRHRTAVRQDEMFDQNRSSAGQLGNEALRRAGTRIEILDAEVEDAALEPQLQQFRAGHLRGNIRTRQSVDLEITVVQEHDPLPRIGYHHALVEVVQSGTDERIPAQLRTLDLAQRRQDPHRRWRPGSSRRRCRQSAFPRRSLDRRS